MLNLVLLDDYQELLSGFDFSSISDQVSLTSLSSHHNIEELESLLADCDILVAMRERTALPKNFLEKLPKLKLLITTGMRNESIDPPDHVVYCGTRILPNPVVELTWALILGLSRQFVAENLSLNQGRWQTTVGRTLQDKTLGLIGLGRSGSAVARIAQVFGMHVVAWSQNLDASYAKSIGVQPLERSQLLQEADVISVHLRLSERTRHLIGAADFAAMRDSALFINTSRAQIVDTDALVAALKSGKIAGAGIDVYDVEPVASGNPLLSAPNTLLTPHIGYVVQENYDLFFEDILENVKSFLAGNPTRVIER